MQFWHPTGCGVNYQIRTDAAFRKDYRVLATGAYTLLGSAVITSPMALAHNK